MSLKTDEDLNDDLGLSYNKTFIIIGNYKYIESFKIREKQ